jgi:hypothetical protein
MSASGLGYDPELQMYVDPPREPDPAHLQFLRWLVERGRFDRSAAGPPSGEFTSEFWAQVYLARDDLGV